MTLSFAGIENVEFYSGHYLDAVLEGDLQHLFRQWAAAEKDHNRRAPWRVLATLGSRYFQSLQAATGENDPATRFEHARGFHVPLLEALGYTHQPTAEPLDDGTVLPVLLALDRDHRPFLWIVDAPFPPTRTAEDQDPLDSTPLAAQLPSDARNADPPLLLATHTFRELLDHHLFRQERAPRWVLFLSGSEAVLAERNKWLQGRYLRFRWDELLRRNDPDALKAVCGLLHRVVLAPDTGLCLHDTLDENSHKHAFAVSGDLKHGVRRALELLANEAIFYRRDVQKQALYQDAAFASKLTQESLTWLYRLLFLFYVEARSEDLHVVPMQSDTYRKGYSLETLRELELVPLHTEKAQNGHFLHDSLKTLFRIVQDGFPAPTKGDPQGQFAGFTQGPAPTGHGMAISPLRSPLFDDERLEILGSVRIRNHVLQQILQLLSLSAEQKRHQRGRISYAQLGINQLGAVYESLLSYTGFFAPEDLFEVANAAENAQQKGRSREDLQSWFVPKSRIGDYADDEIVRDEHDKKVLHPKGTFLYRLSGRHREKSASYYTPEVLTRCLVKYSLKELLYTDATEHLAPEPRPKFTAAQLLDLTICEPAMGSGAFLLEAVDQLADAYLQQAQKERGTAIPPEHYQTEKRRVKARLATSNCHGVDLNPTAVELAKVSLWLGTMHKDGKCPWFGLRLATGNSLIGARRQVFATNDVIRNGTAENPKWLDLVPTSVPLRATDETRPVGSDWTLPPRPKGTIYHFLLPAEGMAPFDKDKVIKDLTPDAVQAIKAWRKKFCAPFTKEDAARLERLSDAVDRLWTQVARERALAARASGDRIAVWGEADYEATRHHAPDLEVTDQEQVARELESSSSAYRRLKLAMDLWCSLWFWPLENARSLPDRELWLRALELVLLGRVDARTVYSQTRLFGGAEATQRMLPLDGAREDAMALSPDATGERLKRLVELSEAFTQERRTYFADCGVADVERIVAVDPMLQVAVSVADRLRFHHWELRFAEVFAGRGGFDLILGNPPWIVVSFDEAGVISDFEPWVAIRKLSAPDVGKQRKALLGREPLRATYVQEFVDQSGTQKYLGAQANYPLLLGMKSNLYRCFLTRSLSLGSQLRGVIGLIHQRGVFDDPRGGSLRRWLMPRLRFLFHFSNKKLLFEAIEDQKHYELSITSCTAASTPRFLLVSNLFHPSTLDQSFTHDGLGLVPGLKTDTGEFDLTPHRSRLIVVELARLRLFATLYDEPGTPALEARLPVVHSEEIASVLERLAAQPCRLGDIVNQYFATQHWNETNSQDDGIIRRKTGYPTDASGWIMQGPHFYVATPFNKTPNAVCDHNQDYTSIDLTSIPANYLPRTNYIPSCDPATYLSRTPKWEGRPVTDFYRHVNRQMVSPTGERTHICALMPPGAGHVLSAFSIAFADEQLLLRFSASNSSLPFDFFVKTSGKNHVINDLAARFPLVDANSQFAPFLVAWALTLNCLTEHFAELWNRNVPRELGSISFGSSDRRLCPIPLLPKWERSCALRSDFERRQALVTLDVLAARALGMTLDELLTIYRVQFPVLQEYERDNLYDQHGRLVPTSSTANGNPAVNLVKLAELLGEQVEFDVHREYHPGAADTEELLNKCVKLAKREADILSVPERCTLADVLSPTQVRWSSARHPKGHLTPLLGLRYTDPGLEPRQERIYPTPWTRHSREEDYSRAWSVLS